MESFKYVVKIVLVVFLAKYSFEFLTKSYQENNNKKQAILNEKYNHIVKNEGLETYKNKCQKLGAEKQDSIFFDHMYIPDIDNYVFVCVLKNKRMAYYSNFKTQSFSDNLAQIKAQGI